MMAQTQPWLRPADGLEFEEQQALEEGRALSQAMREELRAACRLPSGPEKDAVASELFARVQGLPYASGINAEPDELTAIRKLAKGVEKRPAPEGGELFDKVLGGWQARCAGCLLGKPVEGWFTPELHAYLRGTGNYPVAEYIRSDAPESVKAGLNFPGWMNPYDNVRAFIDQVECMPEDDDTNYTVIGLRLLETYGRDFTSEDVAECWMTNLPIFHLCTAERIAYRNLVASVAPPLSASLRNGYREWIGAQIRADLFGYVNPGDPSLAAEMAWRDARISHVKNGIYGEMWAAAMIAAAFSCDDYKEIPLLALGVIPEGSRLSKAVRETASWRGEGIGWEEALRRVHATWDEYNKHHWCHIISNAQVVTASLLWGEGDLERTLGISIVAGFDTDCNAATAGSVIGVLRGAKALPEKWIAPLHDTLQSGVDGMGRVSIRELASRTLALCPTK